MEIITTDWFILHSVLYCILFCLCLVPIGLVNPRMMLQDYPKEIIALVPPKTDMEKRQGIYFAAPLLIIMIGYPALVSWYYAPRPFHFMELFMIMWGMMLVMNIFDLLVLDWMMFCTITPRFIMLKGTEGSPGYKNYLFHFVGFLKGVVITGLISGLSAGVIQVVS
jgi:hypothetical protein